MVNPTDEDPVDEQAAPSTAPAAVQPWKVLLKGTAKKAMRPGNLQPAVMAAAVRGLAEIQTNPKCGRPLTNDPRWVWDDKVAVPELRILYEIDEDTMEVTVRYIGERGSVPY